MAGSNKMFVNLFCKRGSYRLIAVRNFFRHLLILIHHRTDLRQGQQLDAQNERKYNANQFFVHTGLQKYTYNFEINTIK